MLFCVLFLPPPTQQMEAASRPTSSAQGLYLLKKEAFSLSLFAGICSRWDCWVSVNTIKKKTSVMNCCYLNNVELN